jgi:two-component system sensor histidine kinase BaeS
MLQLDDPGLEIPQSPMDINPIVNDLAGDHRRAAAAKGQMLRFEPGIDLPMVEVNETELSQAITHILSNALLYTPEGGSIVLRTRQENQTVVIEIEDTGIGISEQDLPHIFKRFYRADQARQTGGHSGLGLAIAQRIIELQSGKIEVISSLGHGSTFRIRLPVAAVENTHVVEPFGSEIGA